MKSYYFYFATLLLLFACDHKESQQVGECAGNPTIPFGKLNCSEIFSDSLVCEVTHLGDFKLEENSKAFVPGYCQSMDHEFRYRNEAGDILRLVLELKSYNSYVAGILTNVPCASDTAKRKAYCYDYEVLQIGLRSADSTLLLLIQVETSTDWSESNQGHLGDFLKILRKKNPDTWVLDVNAVIRQGTLSYATAFNQEFYATIDLLGATFRDVISNDITFFTSPKPPKYYYNAEYGLVGFIDQAGVLWRLDI